MPKELSFLNTIARKHERKYVAVPDSSKSNSSITKSAVLNGTIEARDCDFNIQTLSRDTKESWDNLDGISHGNAGWSVLPEREFKEVYKKNKVDEKKWMILRN